MVYDIFLLSKFDINRLRKSIIHSMLQTHPPHIPISNNLTLSCPFSLFFLLFSILHACVHLIHDVFSLYVIDFFPVPFHEIVSLPLLNVLRVFSPNDTLWPDSTFAHVNSFEIVQFPTGSPRIGIHFYLKMKSFCKINAIFDQGKKTSPFRSFQ